MKTKYEDFEVCIPDLSGDAIAERVMVRIPLEWDEEMNQWLVGPEAEQIIQDTKARHMGLLLPWQFRELRDRFRFTQKQMGELFQVGEKSWTRWESGRQRPTRSMNLLIRALYDRAISINYLLKRAGKPPIEESAVVTEETHSSQLVNAIVEGNPPFAELVYEVTAGEMVATHEPSSESIEEVLKALCAGHGDQRLPQKKVKQWQIAAPEPPCHTYTQPHFG